MDGVGNWFLVVHAIHRPARLSGFPGLLSWRAAANQVRWRAELAWPGLRRCGPWSSHAVLGFQTLLEPITLAVTFDDVAMVRDPIEQRTRHLGIAKDLGPFAKFQICG